MPLLTTSEALHVSDSFLVTLYGDDIFRRWKELKDEMKFITEREYVSWLIDVANHYKREEEVQQDLPVEEEADLPDSKEGISNYVMKQEVECIDELDDGVSIDEQRQVGAGHNVDALQPTVSGGYAHDDIMTHQHETQASQCYSDQGEDEWGVEGDGDLPYQDNPDPLQEDSGQRVSHQDTMTWPGNVPQRIKKRHEAAADRVGSVAGGSLHSSSAKQYSCEFCYYNTNMQQNLKRHIVAVHHRVKPYVCDHCEYQTAQKVNLLRHLKRRHALGLDSAFMNTS